MTALSIEQIQAALSTVDAGPFGALIHYEGQVGSTNDIARQLADEDAPVGTLVITDEQIAGRGRMGRRWDAPFGVNLLMSVLFRPEMAPTYLNRLVMACGMAISEGCETLTGVRVDVKWPNDLLIGGKKFTGILPEASLIGDELAWVIVGMGINVNQEFAEDDLLSETATSLKLAIGQVVDRMGLLVVIMSRLNHWNRDLKSAALLDAWRSRCVTIGQRVQVRSGDLVVEGLAEDLDKTGALMVVDDAGERHRLTAGESSMIREDG